MKKVKRKHRAKRVSPLARTHSIIRKLLENKTWLPELIAEFEKGCPHKETYMDMEGDILILPDKVTLLTKPANRKEHDVKRLALKLSKMVPFMPYPLSVTENLSRHGMLKGFPKGSVLFKCGDEALYAFFLLRGVVEVRFPRVEEPFLQLAKYINEDLHEKSLRGKDQILLKGYMIGRQEILYGERRERNAIVTEDVLCIRFERKYLIEAVRPVIDNWFKVGTQLRQFKFLRNFSYNIMRELSKQGKIKHYRPKQLINTPELMNFLIEGEVAVIQRLLVQRCQLGGKEVYILHPDQEATSYKQNVEAIFFQVFILTRGAYFGLGERMSKNILWTNTHVKCIQYIRTEVFQYGDYAFWEGEKEFLDHIYPTTKQIFNYFLYNKKWSKFKNDLTRQCRTSSRPKTIHDVPLPLRVKHSRIRRSFLKKYGVFQMSDYLLGGAAICEDELKYHLVLDPGEEERKNLFDRCLTHREDKVEEVKKKDKKPEIREMEIVYDPSPDFFFYRADHELPQDFI